MTEPAPADAYCSIEQAAAKLRLDVKFLKSWLHKNPFSRHAAPHYAKFAGRDKVFNIGHLTLIYYQLRDIGIIKEQIDIWDGQHYEVDRATPGETDGIIYFVKVGESIKIGYSRSLSSRFHRMATDAPGKLELLHWEPGTMNQEKCFHRHFSGIRTRGEWFKITPEIVSFLAERRARMQPDYPMHPLLSEALGR